MAGCRLVAWAWAVRRTDHLANKNFIQGAIKHPGALHEMLGIPQGKKIPQARLAAAAKAKGKLGQRARFAQVLEHIRNK